MNQNISYRNQGYCIDCDVPAVTECKECHAKLCGYHAKNQNGLCEDCYRDEYEFIATEYRKSTVQTY